MRLGLARRRARQIETASLFYAIHPSLRCRVHEPLVVRVVGPAFELIKGDHVRAAGVNSLAVDAHEHREVLRAFLCRGALPERAVGVVPRHESDGAEANHPRRIHSRADRWLDRRFQRVQLLGSVASGPPELGAGHVQQQRDGGLASRHGLVDRARAAGDRDRGVDGRGRRRVDVERGVAREMRVAVAQPRDRVLPCNTAPSPSNHSPARMFSSLKVVLTCVEDLRHDVQHGQARADADGLPDAAGEGARHAVVPGADVALARVGVPAQRLLLLTF